jgi:ribosomal protein S18 acetylase RimI-like enzyme
MVAAALQMKPAFTGVPASRYTFAELAEIYNQTRVDYIVPMPMNAKRMEAYIQSYDIDLDASVVAFDRDDQMAGVGMLGLRGDRAWITRLGVLPDRRGNNLGRFLMDSLLDAALKRGARLAQLEVIKGNIPAHRLFAKLGFRETRELLVVRRPPGKPSPELYVEGETTPMNAEEIEACLIEKRGSGASWLDESRSLAQAGGLRGLKVMLPDGQTGWAVYQTSALQLAYVTLHTPAPTRDSVAQALLYALHEANARQDTKVENLPALDLRWPAYQRMGYVEAFRRIEMFLYF